MEREESGGYPVSEAEQVSKAAGSACFQSNQMLVYIHTGTTSSAAQLKILKIYQNQLNSNGVRGEGREDERSVATANNSINTPKQKQNVESTN